MPNANPAGLDGNAAAPGRGPTDETRGSEEWSFGPYRVEAELGRGGQARVYLARDTRLSRAVALKILSPERSVARTSVERLQREAEAASRLDHPGICTVYEAGELDGRPFLAMQYVSGENLASAVSAARDGAVPPPLRLGGARAADDSSDRRAALDLLLTLFERAARALHAAHEAGLVHRDVKPANIMVGEGGEPVLVDFGLARDHDSELHTLTQTGEFLGTPAYMSPEQLGGSREGVDRRADVYSLAATLWECLTLERPFGGDSFEALTRAILSKEPLELRAKHGWVPRDLSIVMEKALEKERERRYATALELAEDLAAVRDRKPIEARPSSPLHRLRKWTHRHPRRALAAGALALVLLGSGVTLAVVPGRDSGSAAAGPSELGSAMDRVRAAFPVGHFTAADAASLRGTIDDVVDDLSDAELMDLRRWIVGSLLAFTSEFPHDDDRWHDTAAAADGFALWQLLADLEPSQFEPVAGPTLLAMAEDGVGGESSLAGFEQLRSRPRGGGPEGWPLVLETAHYDFHSARVDAASIEPLAVQLDALHAHGFDRFLAPTGAAAPKGTVWVFAERAAYRAAGGSIGTFGTYSPARDALLVLLPDDESVAGATSRVRTSVFREAWREALGRNGSSTGSPAWLREGLAENFAHSLVVDDRVTFRLAPEGRRGGLPAESPVDLTGKWLWETDDLEFLRDPTNNYANAESLVYFLVEVCEDEAAQTVPQRLFQLAPKVEDPGILRVQMAHDVDVDELDARWRAWRTESLGIVNPE